MDKTLREGFNIIFAGLKIAKDVAEHMPSSREMSLVLTKIDEARLWCCMAEDKASCEVENG